MSGTEAKAFVPAFVSAKLLPADLSASGVAQSTKVAIASTLSAAEMDTCLLMMRISSLLTLREVGVG